MIYINTVWIPYNIEKKINNGIIEMTNMFKKVFININIKQKLFQVKYYERKNTVDSRICG